MSKKVTFNIIRDDNESLLLDGEDWGITGLENWANLSHALSVTENANYDGGLITNNRVASIDRTIEARLKDSRLNERMRERILSFFNPKHEYEVHLEYQGMKRYCKGVQYGFSCDNGNVYQPITFSWTILCTQPYMLSEDNFGKDIANIDGYFGFPFVSLVKSSATQHGYQTGFIAGAYSFSNVVDIVNDGDVETYLHVVIIANGPVTNPAIHKDGKYVKILDTLAQDDVVEIDFTKRPPSVTKNGENIINLSDRTSSFTGMQLDVGVNKISYGADDGENNMSVSVYFEKRYLGI